MNIKEVFSDKFDEMIEDSIKTKVNRTVMNFKDNFSAVLEGIGALDSTARHTLSRTDQDAYIVLRNEFLNKVSELIVKAQTNVETSNAVKRLTEQASGTSYWGDNVYGTTRSPYIGSSGPISGAQECRLVANPPPPPPMRLSQLPLTGTASAVGINSLSNSF